MILVSFRQVRDVVAPSITLQLNINPFPMGQPTKKVLKMYGTEMYYLLHKKMLTSKLGSALTVAVPKAGGGDRWLG